MMGLKVTVGTAVIPALISLVEMIDILISRDTEDWFQRGADKAANFINTVFEGTPLATEKIEELDQRLSEMPGRMAALAPAIGNVLTDISEMAENAQKHVDDLNAAMQLSGVIGDVAKSQDQLNAELAELQERAGEIAASGVPLGLTPDQLEELGDINQRITDIKTKLEEEAIAHEENTKRILLSLAERKLGVDGWTNEEIAFLESLMTQWGLLDEDAAAALANMNSAIDKFNSGGSLDNLYNDLDKILKKILEINRTPIAPKVGNAPTPPRPPGSPNGPGGQHGLNMIVPPGFPGDTYPIRATSGERVTIAPAGSSYSYGGDTITIINRNAAAAVITKAMIADRKRARLNASMGR